MRSLSRPLALVLTAAVLLGSMRPAQGCGPSYTTPIFVFTESPDLPFEEYIGGKIGILQPTFGRKTLFIAYRYLAGGAFTDDEQQQLADALRAKTPEANETKAVQTWVARRKEAAPEETLPAIYTERSYGGYDFFPNCTGNAFEVATETLRDRVARFGLEDTGVRAWLAGQDLVFQNCAGGAQFPAELGAESPAWLRKDRDYQIAAAYFYSLNFDEARQRFERIAADPESSWQETADYLVARTLVRQASLAVKEETKQEVYQKAELHLQKLLNGRGKFHNASRKLLALIKYRIHPEERTSELAGVLMYERGNENLRQDLIDYTWLLDEVETQVLKEKENRKKVHEKSADEKSQLNDGSLSKKAWERYERIRNGEAIEISLYEKDEHGQSIYTKQTSLDFKPDVSEDEVLQSFEVNFGRELTPEETASIRNAHELALQRWQDLTSPNRKWNKQSWWDYEGCTFDCQRLTVGVPGFIRADELSDWIFTFQTEDRRAYAHAFSRWQATASLAWFVAAMARAERTSRGLTALMSEAAKVERGSPAFGTVAYHLVRLKIDLGKTAEARKQLDEIISWHTDVLPLSARNQFLEQRVGLAEDLDEFLKFSSRLPLAFYSDGQLGKMSDLLEREKGYWSPQYSRGTKEEYEHEIEERYKNLLPSDNLSAFDEKTIDVLNWHFPLQTLAVAARRSALPEHLQRHLALLVWTRAILLKNDDAARQIAPEVSRLVPEIAPFFSSYLRAGSARERHRAALYILLKSPSLSPFLTSDVRSFTTNEDLGYYFESSWWCPLSETTYKYDEHDSQEVPKIVARPGFLSPQQMQAAQRERQALIAIGDGKIYLGKRVLEWAAEDPEDPRIPEALYIASEANRSYKYGCGGWQNDEATLQAASELLRDRYPNSPWTERLDQAPNN